MAYDAVVISAHRRMRIIFGNIITAAFWKIRADLKGDPAEVHNTVKNVLLADMVFTLPGFFANYHFRRYDGCSSRICNGRNELADGLIDSVWRYGDPVGRFLIPAQKG